MIELRHNLNPDDFAPLLINMHEASFLLNALQAMRELVRFTDKDSDDVFTDLICFMTDKLFKFNEEYYNLPAFPPLTDLTLEDYIDALIVFNKSWNKLQLDKLDSQIVK